MFCFQMSNFFRVVDAVCSDLEFNIIIYADSNYSQIVVLYCIKVNYWMIINIFYIIRGKHITNNYNIIYFI